MIQINDQLHDPAQSPKLDRHFPSACGREHKSWLSIVTASQHLTRLNVGVIFCQKSWGSLGLTKKTDVTTSTLMDVRNFFFSPFAVGFL